MASGTERGRGKARLPPPVRVVEVAAVVDHAEGVVEGRVDQPAARAVGEHALQALCAWRRIQIYLLHIGKMYIMTAKCIMYVFLQIIYITLKINELTHYY